MPPSRVQRHELGGYLCGIRADGELVHDPDDDSDECVVVELRVGADLEPQWRFWRPGDDEQHPIKAASARAKFAVYRVDAHLRWSRTSALGKLTEFACQRDHALLPSLGAGEHGDRAERERLARRRDRPGLEPVEVVNSAM